MDALCLVSSLRLTAGTQGQLLRQAEKHLLTIYSQEHLEGTSQWVTSISQLQFPPLESESHRVVVRNDRLL